MAMGFGFASAGSLLAVGLGIKGIKRAPEMVWHPSRGFVRLYSAGFLLSIP